MRHQLTQQKHFKKKDDKKVNLDKQLKDIKDVDHLADKLQVLKKIYTPEEQKILEKEIMSMIFLKLNAMQDGKTQGTDEDIMAAY